MTERRPHWSDDLIDAVRDAVDVEFDDIWKLSEVWKLSEDSILAVIAAVEDNRPPSLSDLQVQHYAELREQAERAGQGLDVEALISARMEQVARAENAEAAIERVRELCDRIWDDAQWCRDESARYAHKYGFLEVVREVRYALEGDSEQ